MKNFVKKTEDSVEWTKTLTLHTWTNFLYSNVASFS